MAAESDSAVLNTDSDGVESVAIEDAVIGQLIGEFGPEDLVGNGGTGDLYKVMHLGDAIGLTYALVGLRFVRVKVHSAGQGGNALVLAHLHVAKFLFVQTGSGATGLGADCLRGCAGVQGLRQSQEILRKAPKNPCECGCYERDSGCTHRPFHVHTPHHSFAQ